MKSVHEPIDYLDPRLPPGLARVPMPVVDATPASLEGYGCLVDDPAQCRIEIVRWPSIGTRPVDAGTGNQGGTTEGVFISEWRGDILYGRNEAVGGHYILAYARTPESAREDHTDEPRRILLWHATTIRMVVSCSLRFSASPSTCRWRFRAMTSRRRSSSASDSAATRGSTFTRTSGTRGCSGRAARSDSSISRAPCTLACQSTFRASLGACSRRQFRDDGGFSSHPADHRRRRADPLRLNRWFLRTRAARLGPEGLVAELLRLLCTDGSRVPEAVKSAHVALVRERLETMPWANDAFLSATRSLIFGGRPFATSNAPEFPARWR